tara:strand:+ start:1187 stop:2290 length:1104 start_codon:yes stop_codon:yes gene_type:complete
MPFNNFFSNKKILITGNTGFKGSWLTTWLLKLNAEIVGISKDIPTNPSMFEELELANKIKHYEEDITNKDKIDLIIHDEKPDIVFHLAAQAIVSQSYEDPLETINTNVIGTANILDSLKNYKKDCSVVIITSDKCYDNVEWPWGYKETDRLGGKDIYSGSKGAAELIINSYVNSFFDNHKHIKIAVGRAGNVIGGGDWAKDRIIVDCVNSWSKGNPVEIRSPDATRPWQHVLEPLSGYLLLAKRTSEGVIDQGNPYNFGPKSAQNKTVLELLKDLSSFWDLKPEAAFSITDNVTFYEAGLLKLNCDKALLELKWEPTLNYKETVKMIGEWYKERMKKSNDMYAFSIQQIDTYEDFAKSRLMVWNDEQ